MATFPENLETILSAVLGEDMRQALHDAIEQSYEHGSEITVDSELSDVSENPVQNKIVKAAVDNKVDKVAGKGLSTNDFTTEEKNKLARINENIDSSLSNISENPVQNKIVKLAVDNKVDKVAGKGLSTNDFTNELKTKLENAKEELTFDELPIEGSSNPVKSNGIAVVNSQMLSRISTLEKQIPHTIYAFHIDSTNDSPEDAVTYLEDAKDMTPAHMDFENGTFSYGSWDKAFFMPRPCMLYYSGTVAYYLDPDDYTKKLDGTPSDISDSDFPGNAMMEWGNNGKIIWYKIVPDESDNTSATVYIADYNVDGSFNCWSFINNQGEQVEHFYTPIYNGSIDSTGRLRSVSGQGYASLCQGKTAVQEIAAAELNNPGADRLWYTEVYSDVTLINLLLILMGKSLNRQAIYGNGRCGQASAASSMLGTGTMDNKGLFYGSNGNTEGVKVFGMENFWGNQWRRYAGHMMVDYVHKVKLTRGKQDGSTAEDYNTTAAGYIDGAEAPQTNNYVTKMQFDKNGFQTKEVGGDSAHNWCDYWYQASGTRYAVRGGSCDVSAGNVGPVYVSLASTPTGASWNFGSAPSCKPLSKNHNPINGLLPSILNAENYTALMKLWFSLNGAQTMIDFSTLCDRWYAITRTGWTGGTRFYHWPGSGSGEGTKVGDNAGMVAQTSTNDTAGRDDYQAVPLFHCLDCNWFLDENGVPHITAIEGVCGNFERYNPDKLVGVIQMTGWHRYVDDAENDVFTHMYTDEIGASGYHPLPEAVNPDGTVRTWVVHAKYASGDDYGCYSGVHPWTYTASHNSAITAFHGKWGSQYGGKTSADDAFLKLMFCLKYANLSADGVLQGCVNYNYQYAVAVQETGVERVILTAAQAANIKIGSTVMVGNPTAFSSGTTLNIDRNQAGMRAKVDRKKVTRKDSVSGGNVAIYIDNGGVTFDTTANTITTTGDSPTYISTSPWYTGSCDNVKGVDGSPTSPGNGTEPVILQGIEYALGAYEVVCDAILKYYKDSSDKYHLTVYVCRDASKYSTGITSDYELVDYEVDCPASDSWQYIAELGYDPDHPEACFQHLIGCTSSQRTKDAIYILASSTSVYEWLSLGSLFNGVGVAGLSVVLATGGLSTVGWYLLARLSSTGNRGTYNGGGN